ncbi:MAG: regulator of sirC expression with transglutaminase-like and TPR domain [Parvicellaceae bacterium]|jgi:regulator of sirC expression with transglutaminase-like and TPR domain
MSNQNEIQALIDLIDDPDEIIFNQIKEKIVSIGGEVIPFLEEAWENQSFGLLYQSRIENIIHKIQFDSIYHGLHDWTKSGGGDLLEGALIINRYQYPDLDAESIREKIGQIRQDIWIELNENLTAFEEIRVFNYILFDVHGFSGNKKNYHAPQNSYISTVLDSKKGNPLSLAILYCILAQQLDIPIFGVNLPSHFVLAYQDKNNIMDFVEPDAKNNGVLFYVNPFSRGTIFNRTEIEQFLDQLKLDQNADFFEPCNNIAIVKRILSNLIYSYEKLGYADKVEELKELQNALEINI